MSGMELMSLGVLDMSIAAFIYVLIKENLILRNCDTSCMEITMNMIRNAVIISCGLFLIGYLMNR